MCRLVCLWSIALSVVVSASPAAEIGFIEEFSLATDRSVPLKQLIPGTEDDYYFHCLHYQNTEQWEKVEETLKPWIDRYKFTPRVIEIQNRQALLNYEHNPQRALELIRTRLDLKFDHQRDELNQKPNLPTALDPAILAPKALNQQAFARYPGTAEGFEDAALDRLVGAELTPDQRRHLLGRLKRPDHRGLAKLIVADLNYAPNPSFGQYEIHRRLLLDQLDECRKLKGELGNETNFVNTYLTRLHPSNDANWQQDRREQEAYLDRLWSFVQGLSPAHNSLKAHVLYHRLVFDRAQGVHDAKRFLTYLQLPRNAAYVEPKYLLDQERRLHVASLAENLTPLTMLPIVEDDEPLVRNYLLHFFAKAPDYKAYVAYVNDQFLKETFAEAKITAGLGNAERWNSLLPPEKYRALKERIDLDFAFTNKTELAADDPVALDLDVKNVGTLLVKVFHINTESYYRQNLKDIDTSINLDGLVANEEQTHTYDEPSLRRVRRHFEFPTLNRRGVYVIDFIGNGKASRALVRKGKLHFLARTSVAGHVITAFNEAHKKQPTATLWLSGNLYKPDKDGTITVPYSNKPGQERVVLSVGDFSSLDTLSQHVENYQLAAAMYVDREELLKGRTAHLLIRPRLSLGGMPVSHKVLEEVRLVITSTDLDKVSTTKEVADLKLSENQETVYAFQVPPRLASVKFVLKAKVQNHSQNQKQVLAAIQQYALNEIDRTEKTEDLHLQSMGGKYSISLLGKTGEVKADRPVQLSFKLRDYTQPVTASLGTDARGRVTLGTLPGVLSVTATGPQGTAHTWAIHDDEHSQFASIHARSGETIEVPYMGMRDKPERAELSLLELRGDRFVVDHFDKISIKNGLLEIKNLPPGDFSLLLKPSRTQIELRVTAGDVQSGYVLGNHRELQVRNAHPLQLDRVETGEKRLHVRLRNANPLARVHVFASRFEPAYSAHDTLAKIMMPEPRWSKSPRAQTQYVAGRDIGDEYRYIIERKFAKKFPGNMLERPSLLLNPWAVRATETVEQTPADGEAMGAMGGIGGAHGGSISGKKASVADNAFANLDFLASPSLVLANLEPDKQGVIEIKREALGPHQQIVIVAVDPENTASRIVSLPEVPTKYLDLRLAAGLDPKQHFTQRKQISVVPANGKLSVADITSTRFETYDSIARLYALFATLTNDPKLIEFGFIRSWPQLKPEEKQSLYLKYASHELHFFLYKKDPEFFRTAILPYLANKRAPRFLDRWLLERDLSHDLNAWNFEQLNTFEQILLGHRVQGQRPVLARLMQDEFNVLAPDPNRIEQLFQTAVKGSSLDTNDPLRVTQLELFSQIGQVNINGIDKNGTAQFDSLIDPSESSVTPDTMGDAPAKEGEFPDFTSDLSLEIRHHQDGKSAKSKTPPSPTGPTVSPHLNLLDAGKKTYPVADLVLPVKPRIIVQEEEEEKLGIAPADEDRVERVKQLYRKLDKTSEWAESNYYKLPLDKQSGDLVTINAFWKDFAAHDPAQPFLSKNVAEASHSFPEMLMALALVDLPFTASEHKSEYKGNELTLTAGSPMIVFHEEIQPAARVAERAPVLVSENFYQYGDRYRKVGNEQFDKFVTEEFLTGTVYGCHIVVTNPTSSRKKTDVLVQIPTGAVPVLGSQVTRSVRVDLEPYHTQALEYHFYFPGKGNYPHYPVQVAADDTVLAFAAPFTFKVVSELSNFDKESWEYVSQRGSNDEVLSFLDMHNLLDVDLDRIAWRMHDKASFERVIKLLSARHVYSDTLWSYSVKHNSAPAIRQYLQFDDDFVNQCGSALESPLLAIDPVVRRAHEHLDYRPLVNARVGQLSRKREILNDRFVSQYQQLLKVLSCHRQLDSDDLMAVTYYLLLQDRVEEALASFERVEADRLATRLQYDYFAAYLDFYKSEPKLARDVAVKYEKYPVERWRTAFASIVNQADEINKREAVVADAEDRNQLQTHEAAAAPAFDFTIDGKRVKLNYQHLDGVTVRYYPMDIELLFSRNPFVQHDSLQFSHIRPKLSQSIELKEKATAHEFELPAELSAGNVLIEITGGGVSQSQAYYSNALRLQLTENYGQLRVTHGKEGSPLAKVYVKVYARMQDGSVRFYKDGYTDLRGRFDYTSLNTNELDYVQRFSLLVLSEEHGAVVREAQPPKR